MENTIKVFGGHPEDVPVKLGEVIVPGDLVKYSAEGWVKLTSENYLLQSAVKFNNVAMAVGYSAAASSITMGGTSEDHIDSIQWAPIAVVKFGSNWTACGQFTRAAEVLVKGDLLVIQSGKFAKFDETTLLAASVPLSTVERNVIFAEVLEGSTETDGPIRISTNGYPLTLDSEVGTAQ